LGIRRRIEVFLVGDFLTLLLLLRGGWSGESVAVGRWIELELGRLGAFIA
jgi:hypothetical protein